MYNFKIGPEITEFKDIKKFNEVFNINKDDYIFTEKLFYDNYLSDLDANFIFYDDYGSGEPKNTVIDEIIKDITPLDIKRLIGIGGGTILDTAKILSMKNPISVNHVFDDLVEHERDKELILIPTTCGTGCEVTAVSVIDMVEKGTKIGKRIECNFADHAVLIEELLDSIPEKVFIYSSIDALIHALEIYVAPTSNPYNDIFCKKSIEMILRNFKYLSENGLDKRFEKMEEFLRASTFAGIALSNTTCGAVHALAMHFGSKYHVAHGEANALFLTGVFKKYAELKPEGSLEDITEIVNEIYGEKYDVQQSIEKIDDLLKSLIQLNSLDKYGVEYEDIERNVDVVLDSQQRLLINNYTELSKDDLIDIYKSTYIKEGV